MANQTIINEKKENIEVAFAWMTPALSEKYEPTCIQDGQVTDLQKLHGKSPF